MTNKILKMGMLLLFSPSLFAIAESNIITELNPLLFANQGIGFNLEYQVLNQVSVGGDFEIFNQNPYMMNGVTANRYIYTIAPVLHYYFLSQEMSGPFIGAKLAFTYSQSSISDSDTTAHSNVFYLAPIVQLGYRFLAKNGFTVSAYIGVGFKSTNNAFEDSSIPATKANHSDWQNAQHKLNKNISRFQPDYGLTIGYFF